MSGFSDVDVSISIKELESMLISTGGPISGTDSEDRDYTGIQELWDREMKTIRSNSSSSLNTQWYNNAQEFWEDPDKCPITDDGVLQGYGLLTPMDTKGSNEFLDKIKAKWQTVEFDRVADCGAGIGRVSRHLLLPRFKHVDLVEQSPRLIASSAAYIGKDAKRTTCIVEGLQDFAPPPGTYDVIWIQWVIGHVHDLDVIKFFKRCALGLKPTGVIVLKDNIASRDYTFVVDNDDSSVSRSMSYIKLLITLSGLKIVLEETQRDFPEELTPVMMFAMTAVGSELQS